MSADNPINEEISSSVSAVPYQVVARRYRPQEFSQLIGQDHIAQALSNAIETDRVGHAYLFTGARGVGKTSSARIFAKALNCIHGPTKTPCNQCEICRAISTGDDIDVLEIDGASNRGIDEIRQLRQNATIRPSRARYKIYIIDEVHMLTREAFNALLKTLEEPPEHVKFIFCTTEPNKIPITILSRCQRFDFSGIDSRSISARLGQILQKEGVKAENGVCETLARRANGSMRDAQSLLEQLLALAPKFIHLDDVHRMLGTVDDQKLFDLLNAVVKNETGKIFSILDQAAEFGVDFSILIEQTLGLYRDLMVIASKCPPESLMYTPVGRYEEIRALATQLGIRRIMASMQILDQTLQRMKYSTQNRILAELALVRLCCLDQLQDISKLLQLLKTGQLASMAAQPVSLISGSTAVHEKKNITAPETGSGSRSLETAAKPVSENRSAQKITVQNDLKPDDNSAINIGKNNGAQKENNVPDKEEFVSPKATNDLSCENRQTSDSQSRNKVGSQSNTTDDPESGFGKIPIASLDNQKAEELWKTILSAKNLGAVSLTGKVFSKVEFIPPNQITVWFYSSNLIGKTHCDMTAGSLKAELEKLIDGQIVLNFDLDPNTPPEEKPQEKKQEYHFRSKREIMRDLDEHPMILEAKKLFNADLTDIQFPSRK